MLLSLPFFLPHCKKKRGKEQKENDSIKGDSPKTLNYRNSKRTERG